MQTSIGKRIKFTHVNNVPKSVKENFIQKFTSETNTNKYFSMPELQTLPYNKKSDLALFHMTINLIQFHFDELETCFANFPIDFQILGITESRLKEANPPTLNLMLPWFTYEHMPRKSSNVGVLLYIKNGINYKLIPALNINKDKELESIFIEILTKNNKNILFGCISSHPCMHSQEFNNLFWKSLPNKLKKESNKEIVLLGDFNIDLINENSNSNASEFLDIIYSSYLIPHITSPTRLTSRSHGWIDNGMGNVITEDAISGNIINTISDHLGQFLILPLYHVKLKARSYPKKL